MVSSPDYDVDVRDVRCSFLKNMPMQRKQL